MTAKSVLIQAADGRHWDLLEMTRDHHRACARRHGLDYWCVYGNPAAPKRGGWAKISLLLAALRGGYERAIWLDADAVIVRPEHNLAAVCAEGLGMVRHPNPDHWNTGVIFASGEPRVLGFLERVASQPENDGAWMEQHALNELAVLPEFRPLLGELPAAFNSTPGAVMDKHPIILAAHGLPMATRRRLLRQWLDRLIPPYANGPLFTHEERTDVPGRTDPTGV